MRLSKTLLFVLNSITVGLAAAFVVLFLRPDPGAAPAPQMPASVAPETLPAPAPASYADAVALAAPAIVNIATARIVASRHPLATLLFGDRFGMPKQQTERSLGSGVIISAQGYILTNHHVIDGADQIQVQLQDGRSAGASVTGTDPDTDLAVLKISLDRLPVITTGRSDDLRVGDVVLAIGNPFGVGQTVTQGIVSATGRSQLGVNTFENFIQTDAAINPGNSGGALINAAGELVGINSAIFSDSGGSHGIGFAIPVALANGVKEQIIRYGRVIRGWLGIEIQDISPELAESMELASTSGVIVAGVIGDGPGDRAGIRPGDVILRANDSAIGNTRQALAIIANSEPGRRLSLEVLRKGERMILEPLVAQRPGN